MNEQDHRPAEPVEDDKGQLLGFQGLADELNERYPNRRRPISRQLVHKWHHHRGTNSFPESVSSEGSGAGRPKFDMEAVDKWYATFRLHHRATETDRRIAPQVAPPVQNSGGNSLAA